MRKDVGPIEIHLVVSEISQVRFLPLVALFLLSQNKKPINFSFLRVLVRESMYSCRFWGEDFKCQVKFLKKP